MTHSYNHLQIYFFFFYEFTILSNGYVNFHSKIYTHCWNINKVAGATFCVHPVEPVEVLGTFRRPEFTIDCQRIVCFMSPIQYLDRSFVRVVGDVCNSCFGCHVFFRLTTCILCYFSCILHNLFSSSACLMRLCIPLPASSLYWKRQWQLSTTSYWQRQQ